MPNAKGFFPEDHPQFIGIYWGGVSSPSCEPIVDWADMILAAVAMFTDYTTVGWPAIPPREQLFKAAPWRARVPHAEYTSIALAAFLSAVLKNVRTNNTTSQQYRRKARKTL